MTVKKQRRALDGVLLLDKPSGISSNKALQIAKRLFNAKKAGHGGSLDPLATGILPIFFGEATKFSRFLLDSDKTYQVTLQLGVRTDSADSDGEVIETKAIPADLSLDTLMLAIHKLTGPIEQVPPMFSAIKQNGQPLYKLARQGIEVKREPRKITVYSIDLLTADFNSGVLALEVHCSKGTYIRTIVDDLGQLLGCGAHVTQLRRIGVGKFDMEKMVKLDLIEALAQEQKNADDLSSLDDLLIPMNSSICDLPVVQLSESAVFYVKNGQAITVPGAPVTGWVALESANSDLLGVGEILSDGRIAPRRLVCA